MTVRHLHQWRRQWLRCLQEERGPWCQSLSSACRHLCWSCRWYRCRGPCRCWWRRCPWWRRSCWRWCWPRKRWRRHSRLRRTRRRCPRPFPPGWCTPRPCSRSRWTRWWPRTPSWGRRPRWRHWGSARLSPAGSPAGRRGGVPGPELSEVVSFWSTNIWKLSEREVVWCMKGLDLIEFFFYQTFNLFIINSIRPSQYLLSAATLNLPTARCLPLLEWNNSDVKRRERSVLVQSAGPTVTRHRTSGDFKPSKTPWSRHAHHGTRKIFRKMIKNLNYKIDLIYNFDLQILETRNICNNFCQQPCPARTDLPPLRLGTSPTRHHHRLSRGNRSKYFFLFYFSFSNQSILKDPIFSY